MEDNRYLYHVANKFIRDEEQSICKLFEILGYKEITTTVLEGSYLRITAVKGNVWIGITVNGIDVLADTIKFFIRCEALRNNHYDYQEMELRQNINITSKEWDKLDNLASDMISHVSNYKWFEQ